MSDEDRDISNADFWKKAGDDYIKQEQYEKAIECYKEAVDLDPNYSAAWNNLGFSYFKLGRLDDAKKVKKKLDELKNKPSKASEPSPVTVKTTPTPTTEPTQKPSYLKSPGLAAFISFFFPGAGHIYDGQSKKGFLLLVGTFIGTILLVIPGIGVWIYGIYDSYKTAHRINFGEIPYKPMNIFHLVIYLVVYIIGVIIVLAVIAAFVFGMSGTTDTPRSGSSPSMTGTIIGTKNLDIGETAVLRSEGDALAVTLVSVDDIKSDGILKVKYQNNGNKAIEMSGGGWTIVDYGGIEYSHYGDQTYNYFTLYPGDSKTLDYTWDSFFWDPFGQSDYNQKVNAIKKGSKIFYTFNEDSSAVASWILYQ